MDSPQKCRDYICALEEERKKIQVFQRELPLCLQLVTSAIESVRQQMRAGQEAMSVERPVLEEFIPLKPSSSPSEEDDGSSRDRKSSQATAPAVASANKKPDWLKSVQLWNQNPEEAADVEPPKKPVAVTVKKTGGAFQPFERQKYVVADPMVSAAAATSSTTTGSGGACSGSSGCAGDDNKNKDKVDKEKDKDYKDKEGQSQSHRKRRRCWSPELHRRFLHALQQLGGSHAATPKQIRELMKVEGLTNDEVKSHLQKYRLHTRRPSPAIQSSSNSNPPPAPQFVVVGGIWMPPPLPDYAVASVAHTGDLICAPPSEIYAPVASLPTDRKLQLKSKKQSHRSPIGPLDSEGRCSADDHSVGDNGDEDTTPSVSPATSSSSQTTTASQLSFF